MRVALLSLAIVTCACGNDTTLESGVSTPDALASADSGSVQAVVDEADSGNGCSNIGDCADGKVCDAGTCVVPPLCVAGEKLCNGSKLQTCSAGGTAWDAVECDDGNPCTVGDACVGQACKPGAAKDGDGDGSAALACGGGDCDDGNAAVAPGKVESCTPVGVDDDCDGQTDEGCTFLNAVGCGVDGAGCGGGKGACSGGHCFWMDAKGYEWTLVPAGTFWMGCNPAVDPVCSNSEKPQHLVDLSAYWIGVYEVTNSNYKVCVDESGGCTVPLSATWGVPGKEQHPVESVDWMQSQAYCKRLGGKLPTEAQWEKAARGGCEVYAGQDCALAEPKYPWGNGEPVCGQQAVFGFGCGTYSSHPVGAGSPQGASPYGAHDMAGNVMEWTLDFFSTSFYATAAATEKDAANAVFSPKAQANVTRGGNYGTAGATLRAGSRGSNYYMSTVTQGVGLRCARAYP